MPLSTFLSVAKFSELETFGQYPTLDQKYRYVVTNDSTLNAENDSGAIVGLWPADRAWSYWVAVLLLNDRTPRLEYGRVPRGMDGIAGVTTKFLGKDWLWYSTSAPGVWPSHPWCSRSMLDAEDVGVPGILQFLNETPFCEPILIAGQEIMTASGQTYTAPESRAEKQKKQEEANHPFATGLRKIDL
jgi:hypothetical protein